MKIKFHHKNGEIKWNTWFWLVYFFLVVPLWIANVVTNNETIAIAQISILGFSLIFLFLDIFQSRRRHKMWDSIWKEEMDIMKEGGWSLDDAKVKKLEELRKEREKYQTW